MLFKYIKNLCVFLPFFVDKIILVRKSKILFSFISRVHFLKSSRLYITVKRVYSKDAIANK